MKDKLSTLAWLTFYGVSFLLLFIPVLIWRGTEWAYKTLKGERMYW